MDRILLLFIVGVTLAAPAWAARPFVTDDARLTSGGSCQLESWTRIYSDSTEFWALPACNPGGNFEVTFGGGNANNYGAESTRDYILQAKTLAKPLETNGWGVGFAAGTVRHPAISTSSNQLGNTYAYIPVSASFHDDQVVVHANLGWLKDRASDSDSTTWGLGGEFRATDRIIAIAEVYGDDRTSPFTQAGLRYAVFPDLFQIDASVGQQVDSGSKRWLSVGVRWTPDRMF